MGAVEARLADPATYSDGTDVGALNTEHAELQAKVEALYARWEELSELA